MIRSRKLLNTARGAPCSARFPGICCGDPETTVWAHLNGRAFGKGLGIKAHDILGFHACFNCHAYTDTGHGTNPILSDAEFWRYILEAVCETYVRVVEAGVVVVPRDMGTPAHEGLIKPRKPKSQRKAIPSRPFPKSQRKFGQ